MFLFQCSGRILTVVTTKIVNHPKPRETIRNHTNLLVTNHKLPEISYNQPQTTRIPQQPASKCIWLILSSKILEQYSTINRFPKSLKNNKYSYFISIFLFSCSKFLISFYYSYLTVAVC